MFEIMKSERREVLFFPETEYWVSFDSPVPLFLPLYSRARFLDLRMIAKEEKKLKTKIAGQSNFDSGFEWAAWFNSVITARSAYDIIETVVDDKMAFAKQVYNCITKAFTTNRTVAEALADIFIRVIELEYDTMVMGGPECNGRFASCTAISYIAGYDMYTDIGRYFDSTSVFAMRIPLSNAKGSSHFLQTTVLPTLDRLVSGLKTSLKALHEITCTSKLTFAGSAFLEELENSIHITELRTIQVKSLYEFVLNGWEASLNQARTALKEAEQLVERRAGLYKIDRIRLDSWTLNPTVYRYRYLWTVKSLYYWRRDEAITLLIANKTFLLSPCFRNIGNALQELTQFPGIETVDSITQTLRDMFHSIPLINKVTDCLNAPLDEPYYDDT